MRNFIVGLVESLTIFGFVFLGIGLIFMIFPLWVAKLNEWGKRQVFTEVLFVEHPRITGAVFLSLSAFTFILYAVLG